jgi:hypothetical protein
MGVNAGRKFNLTTYCLSRVVLGICMERDDYFHVLYPISSKAGKQRIEFHYV